jgi:hydroxymethylpyrimidine/phosphomethylpyrimidine kinase
VSPAVLSLAGLDPSASAGLVADAEAIRVAGGSPRTVCAALTAQGPGGALGVQPVPSAFVEAQLDAVGSVDALKTGMLGTAAVVEVVASRVAEGQLPRPVVDPVARASSGLELLDAAGREMLRGTLLPLAAVVTPNLDEAAWLTGRSVATVEQMEDAARALLDFGCGAAVVKGGHLDGAVVDVVLRRGGELRRIERPREPGTARGTGCRFASFLATRLAAGDSLRRAAAGAGAFVARYVLDGA